MQVTHGLTKVLALPKKHPRTAAKAISTSSKEAVAEINAYIAIRDDLLAEAEQVRTRAKIDSLSVANDFVVTCLKPARPPYEAQCLSAADAARERERCESVKARIAELSSQIAAQSNNRHCASIR